MAEIDILMAAYNGEKYIAEQIESILAQTFQDFRLVIRDDDSQDRTPEIIAEYAARYPGKIEVVHDEVKCHSATRNFFQLLTYAKADYVMFSDQDDYWLPYKVQISLDYMKKAEHDNPGEPVLVFTGLHVVDAELHSMDSFMALGLPRSSYTTMELLMENCVSGCTEMANRKLYEAIGSYSPQITIHDYWLALHAYACGVICNVPMALILYRQHSNNLIGAAQPIYGLGYFLSKLCGAITKLCSLNPVRKLSESKQKYYKASEFFTFFRSKYYGAIKPDKLQELDTFLQLWGKSVVGEISSHTNRYILQDRIPLR